MSATSRPVVILGAGTIGCFLGGHWQASGVNVLLLGRAAKMDALAQSGLALDGGTEAHVAGDKLVTSADPAVMATAGLVVVCVKSPALEAAIGDLAAHCPEDVPILCLMNGLAPLRALKAGLPQHQVLGGMVPFNVIWESEGQLRRASAGEVVAQSSPATAVLAGQVRTSGCTISLVADPTSLMLGKLLLNLNNPINALSGLGLHKQLGQRPFRLIYAQVLREALSVLAQANAPHAAAGAVAPEKIVRILKLPNLLFNTIAMRIQKIDRKSQTSMAVDLAAGRKTEVDTINGEIMRMAHNACCEAPLNAGLVRLIHAAEQGGKGQYSAAELARELGLP